MTECSRGRATKWWKQPECVLYTRIQAVMCRGGNVSPSRLKSLFKHGVDWTLDISVLRGWTLMILVTPALFHHHHQQVSFHRTLRNILIYIPGFGFVWENSWRPGDESRFSSTATSSRLTVCQRINNRWKNFFMKCSSPLRMNCNNRCDAPTVHENIIIQLKVQLDGAVSRFVTTQ